MQPLQAINALSITALRKTQASQEPAASNPIQGSANLTPWFFNYSLSHPRAVDSEGVPEGTSPLGKRLDVCW